MIPANLGAYREKLACYVNSKILKGRGWKRAEWGLWVVPLLKGLEGATAFSAES